MKIIDILNDGKRHLSMEVFPPKTDAGIETIAKTLAELIELNPSFISCTYGANGGTCRNTLRVTKMIDEVGVTALAHLTCINSTEAEIAGIIAGLKEIGVENILALRGDKVEPIDRPIHFNNAIELIRAIKQIYPEACIGGACYPEKHPDAETKDIDIQHLKEKQDAGCSFFTTQMFFENSNYYNYLYRLREADITIPIIAGIMPVTSKQQMKKSIELSGCSIPQRFRSMVDMFGDNPEAMMDVGITYASEQILDLFANGIQHVHIYTMNKPEVARGIMRNLQHIL